MAAPPAGCQALAALPSAGAPLPGVTRKPPRASGALCCRATLPSAGTVGQRLPRRCVHTRVLTRACAASGPAEQRPRFHARRPGFCGASGAGLRHPSASSSHIQRLAAVLAMGGACMGRSPIARPKPCPQEQAAKAPSLTHSARVSHPCTSSRDAGLLLHERPALRPSYGSQQAGYPSAEPPCGITANAAAPPAPGWQQGWDGRAAGGGTAAGGSR